ncbi:LMBR1-like membrane protein [Cladochytrium replicatum]|nr:LMBR1-like membrane protein [Cladochytrium replicatum]
MVDIALVITSVVFAVLIILAAVYFLVYFQHPDDKWVAWFPKIVVVLCISLAAYNIFLLPLDVANQRGEFYRSAIPMTQIQLAFYIATTVISIVAVPFTVFYYEGIDDSDESDEKSGGQSQIAYALKWLIPTLVFAAAVIIVMYYFIGSAVIPVTVVTSGMYLTTAVDFDYCGVSTNISNAILTVSGADSKGVITFGSNNMMGIVQPCYMFDTSVNVKVSPLVYIVAVVSLCGWVLFTIFGGVGLVAVPYDFINDYKFRPKPINAAEYKSRKTVIGEEAKKLMEAGKTLMEEIKNVNRGAAIRNARRRNTIKNRERNFRKDVLLLEYHYRRLEDSYRMQGGSFILQILQLICGIVGAILSTCWGIHIGIFLIPTVLDQNPLSPFLNDLFTAVGGIAFVGTALYALFSFYLLGCVIKGNAKLGMRIVFVVIHPMKVGETMMNSLVFNAGIVLISSLSVAQFCALAFANYAQFTSTQSVFGVQIQNLVYLKYVYIGFIVGVLGIAVITAIYVVYRPYKKEKMGGMKLLTW